MKQGIDNGRANNIFIVEFFLQNVEVWLFFLIVIFTFTFQLTFQVTS